MRQILSAYNFNGAGLRMLVWLATIWIVCAMPLTVAAQMVVPGEPAASSVEIPENLTQEQVRDIVARLSDDQVRQLIISQLDKLVAQQAPPDDPSAYATQLREGIQVAWNALSRMFTSGDKIYALPGTILRELTDSGRISGWYLLFQLIGLMVAGWGTERIARHLLEKTSVKPVDALSTGKRFDFACYGALLGLVELGAFVGGAILFVEITSLYVQAASDIWFQVVWCLLLLKLVSLAVRQVASPGHRDARLIAVTDTAARQAFGWSMILAGALVLPQPLVEVAAGVGADTETLLLLGVVFGAIFVALLITLVIHLRHYGTELIMGDDGDSGSIRARLAGIWWILTIVYILSIWFMSVGKRAATGESSLIPGLASLLLFALIPFFDQGLKWLITIFFTDKAEEEAETILSADSPGGDEAVATSPAAGVVVEAAGSTDIATRVADVAPAYIAIALRYARVLMVLAILTVFVRLWEIDIRAISAQLVGQRFASALFDISITVLLTWALWGVIRISIERKLDDGKGSGAEAEGESDAGGTGGTRVETILPLIRAFIKITLIVMAVMISLSSVGVNVGPLIAGAGVIGIAIGFGAQTLVRDIVSGFFYLLDDAFRIGEYVVIDQIRGTVEKISVRSFQLRHHNGPVHTIPYGEIRTLTNWSRDWSIMKFELRIAFETNIDMVRKIIKQIGIDMMADPVFGPLMLQPVKSQGVNRMDDSALIIRCKFMTIPGQQYLVRREAFTRIQRVFEEKGIQFAPRRVLVEATTPHEAIKGAAAVLDQEETGKASTKTDL